MGHACVVTVSRLLSELDTESAGSGSSIDDVSRRGVPPTDSNRRPKRRSLESRHVSRAPLAPCLVLLTFATSAVSLPSSGHSQRSVPKAEGFGTDQISLPTDRLERTSSTHDFAHRHASIPVFSWTWQTCGSFRSGAGDALPEAHPFFQREKETSRHSSGRSFNSLQL